FPYTTLFRSCTMLQLPAIGSQFKGHAEIGGNLADACGVGADVREFNQRWNVRGINFVTLQFVNGGEVSSGKGSIDQTHGDRHCCSWEMAFWCGITSTMMKFRNFSA